MAFYKCKVGMGNKIAVGKFTTDLTNPTVVHVGFKPDYLILWGQKVNDASVSECVYNKDVSTTKYMFANAGTYAQSISLGSTSASRLTSINDDGFTFAYARTDYDYDYIAVGE